MSRSNDIIRKLSEAEVALKAVLEGEKLPYTEWLHAQGVRMYDGHLIAEPPSFYMMLPGEGEEDRALKGVTRYHPVSHRLMLHQKPKVQMELHSAGIRNFHVLGTNIHLRYTDQASMDAVLGHADHFIATKGDFHTLYQFIALLNRNATADDTDKKMVILQNRDAFWGPTIEALGLKDPGLARVCGLTITDSTAATKNAILYSDGNKDREPVETVQPIEFISFASTQPKKIDETGQIIRHEKWRVKLGEAVHDLGWFLSADEVSRTFEGNAYEKLEALLDRIYNHLGIEKVYAHFREMGIDPEKVVFVVNDTGISFIPDMSDEPEFAGSRHESVKGRPWPGVEIGPIADAEGGVLQMLAKYKKALQRTNNTEPQRFRDTQLYMAFRLAQKREDVKVLSCFGTDTGFITTDPTARENGTIYTEDASIPDGQPQGAQGKTKSELGHNHLVADSSQARAFRTFGAAMGIKTSSKPSFEHVAERNWRKKLRLVTQANWISGPHAYGDKKLKPTALSAGWLTTKNAYTDFETMAADADGFILGPHSQAVLDNFEAHSTSLSLLFWKMVTHRQILHDTMANKPFWVVNPALSYFNTNGNADLNWDDPAVERQFMSYLRSLDPAEHPWGKQLLLYAYYHQNALIKQRPKYIFDQIYAGNTNTFAEQLKYLKRTFSPRNIALYGREDFGRDRSDMFEVTVLGSASTRKIQYLQSAERLAYNCAEQGIHLRTGGGRYGVMNAVANGFNKFCERYPERADHTHISAVQMPRTLQFEGLCFDPKDVEPSGNRCIYIEPGMDKRMNNLFRSPVVIVEGGGAGTLEEIAKFMDLKNSGDALTQKGQMIIINHQMGPGRVRLYDPLLATIPGWEGIPWLHVVDDDRQAFEKTMQIRNMHASALRPSLPGSHI